MVLTFRNPILSECQPRCKGYVSDSLQFVRGKRVPESTFRRVGQRIRQAREEARLTQEQLAQRLGMSDSGLTLWEKGTRRIPLDQLERIAVELGKPMWYFLGAEPPSADNIAGDSFTKLTEANKDVVRAIVETLRAQQERTISGGSV